MVVYDNGELEPTGGLLLPDGSLLDESSDLGTLSLPYADTSSASSALLDLTQTGDGRAARFGIDNTGSFLEALLASSNGGGSALKALNSGTGRAGLFQILNDNSGADALAVTTNGTGRAGEFQVTNASSRADALFAETVGNGRAGMFRLANAESGAEAVRVETDAISHAGVFEIDNPDSDSSALQGLTDGTGPAVQGVQRGPGGQAGNFRVNSSSNEEAALYAVTNGTGPTVKGMQFGSASDSSAHAGFFQVGNANSDAEALLVRTNGSGEAFEAVQTGTGAHARAGQFVIAESENENDALRAVTFGGGMAARLGAAKNAVVRDNPDGNVVLINNHSDQNGPDVLGLKAGPSNPDLAVNYVSFYDRTKTSVGAIEGNGSGGVRYKTSGADYAEALPVAPGSVEPAPADLVGVRGGTVRRTTRDADHLMVVTGQSAVLGNAAPSGSAEAGRRVPVAFVGQVPVRVRGPAEVGDLIVASGRDDGTARAVAPADYRRSTHGPVAGRAWSANSKEGVAEVTVAVGLGRSGALAERLRRQQAQIDSLRETVRRLDHLERRLARLEAGGRSMVAGLGGSGFLLMIVALGGGLGAGLLWRRSSP